MPVRFLPSILLLTVALAITGCPENQYVNEPPPGAKDAEKWWDHCVVDHFELDFLAVLCVASDVHRQNGTSARFNSYGDNNVTVDGVVNPQDPIFGIRFSLPIPKAVQARAISRLIAWKPFGEQPSYRGYRWHWEGGKGCSPEKAEEIWQEAEKEFGWKPGP